MNMDEAALVDQQIESSQGSSPTAGSLTGQGLSLIHI